MHTFKETFRWTAARRSLPREEANYNHAGKSCWCLGGSRAHSVPAAQDVFAPLCSVWEIPLWLLLKGAESLLAAGPELCGQPAWYQFFMISTTSSAKGRFLNLQQLSWSPEESWSKTLTWVNLDPVSSGSFSSKFHFLSPMLCFPF